ncbi:hypothetical protein HYX58_05300 [Candidatus Dependentiae bacterium]|nr:hypothetical protein [Candidatus Dependentiae bacterium]
MIEIMVRYNFLQSSKSLTMSGIKQIFFLPLVLSERIAFVSKDEKGSRD